MLRNRLFDCICGLLSYDVLKSVIMQQKIMELMNDVCDSYGHLSDENHGSCVSAKLKRKGQATYHLCN